MTIHTHSSLWLTQLLCANLFRTYVGNIYFRTCCRFGNMARYKQTARKSTGGEAPPNSQRLRMELVQMATDDLEGVPAYNPPANIPAYNHQPNGLYHNGNTEIEENQENSDDQKQLSKPSRKRKSRVATQSDDGETRPSNKRTTITVRRSKKSPSSFMSVKIRRLVQALLNQGLEGPDFERTDTTSCSNVDDLLDKFQVLPIQLTLSRRSFMDDYESQSSRQKTKKQKPISYLLIDQDRLVTAWSLVEQKDDPSLQNICPETVCKFMQYLVFDKIVW